MSLPGSFFMRWRVRLGYPLAVVVLWFSRPVPRSILLGGLVGIIGLWLRAYAAGYLHKQEVLTVTGPYAYTRNPLYLDISSSSLLRNFLFRGDAARRNRIAHATRPCLYRICTCGPALFPAFASR